MSDSEPSLGELARDMRALTEAVSKLTTQLERNYVRKDVYDAHRSSDSQRLVDVEARQTWIARTSVTALVLPILVVVVTAIMLGMIQ